MIDLVENSNFKTRCRAYRWFHQLNELGSFILGKFGDLEFTMSLIAQEQSCQMSKVIRGPIQCQ